MSIQVKRILFSLVVAYGSLVHPQAPPQSRESAGESTLQKHYEAALRFTKEGNIEQASTEYRVFLADALGEIAVGHSRAGDYARASSLFEAALVLMPDSPTLRVEYSRSALAQGDFAHAEDLARGVLKDSADDQESLAHAHEILGRVLLATNRDHDARKELETAVALDPTFSNGYDLAVVCLDLDDEKCAAQMFAELQASFGDTPEVHMTFGRAYGNSDFQPRAVEEFRKVIAESPRLPGAHYSLAAALLASGEDEANVQAAEEELKNELAISPNDFLTYAALGKIAVAHHRYPEAEGYLKRAILLNSKNPDAYLYLGQMYFDTNRFAEARPLLKRAIELTTDVSRNRYQIQKAHFLLGKLLMQEHREQEAHAEMQIAHNFANIGLILDKSKLADLLVNTASASPSTSPAAPSAATHTSADPEAMRSVNALEKQLSQPIADSYNNLGVTAAAGSDYASALKYFENAAKWNPTLDGLDYNRGRAAFMASRFSDAISPLARYLSLHRDDSSIRGALAMSQFMTRDYTGCIATLKGMDEKIASIPQMQYILGASMVKTGQISAGKVRLESLEKLHPEIAEVHGALGEAFSLQGDRQKAKEEVKAAIQLNGSDPETHYELGKIELDAGDANAAVTELEIATRLLPNEARFHKELAGAYRKALRTEEADKESHIYDALQASHAPAPVTNSPGSHESKVR